MSASNLIFLKLGGSLITDKDQPETALVDQIHMLLSQISAWRADNPQQRLLLGHGSGSFGHHAAAQFDTRAGVRSLEQGLGYQQVWYSARKLNQIVLDQARLLNLPLIAFPPSACVVADNHEITTWNFQPLTHAFDLGLVPLVYGDVVSDLSPAARSSQPRTFFLTSRPVCVRTVFSLRAKCKGFTRIFRIINSFCPTFQPMLSRQVRARFSQSGCDRWNGVKSAGNAGTLPFH